MGLDKETVWIGRAVLCNATNVVPSATSDTGLGHQCLFFPLISTNSCVFLPALDLLLNRPGLLHPSLSLNALTPWLTYYVLPKPSACINFYY